MSTCLVLFRPRSGSSLLIQTLGILGKPVLGKFETNCDQQLNPRGFWDIPTIRDHGLTAETREVYRDALSDAAVKVLLPATFENDGEQWRWFADIEPTIFITYRHPLEQALSSNAAFQRKRAGTREHFIGITRALRSWTLAIGQIVRFVRENQPALIPRIRFVGYQEHIDDPHGFVEGVARHAGLADDEERFRRAVENIDLSLYRFRADELPVEYRRWYDAMPAGRYFEALRTNPESVWGMAWPTE